MKLSKMVVAGLLPVMMTFQCSLFDWNALIQPDPTKTRMEGIWQVTEAYDADGTDILNQISYPVTALDLSDQNTIVSTAGPMIMYLVYGKSKYTQIASKIDQTFNYASLAFDAGEWFIEGGVVDRFTLEMKLGGVPGQKALTDLLGMLGIGSDYLDVTIYHKFMDVKVSFDDGVDSVMTWEFDSMTEPEYNKKDSKGNYVLWNGWEPAKFSHCKFILTKRVEGIKDLVTAAKK